MKLFLALSGFGMLNIILGLIVLAIAIHELYIFIQGRRSATQLTEEEFKEGMRKAQVVDIREREDFNAGHILGARNIAFSTLANSYGSFRKDQPIYLYERKKSLAVRAAIKLKKQGFKDIYILKTGYQEWSGKTKSK